MTPNVDHAERHRAERLRTVLAYAPVLALEVGSATDVVDVRAVETAGSLLLVVAAGGEVAALLGPDPVQATVHAARTIPVAVADRVFDPVTVHGRTGLVPFAGLAAALMALARTHPMRMAELTPRLDASVIVRFDVLEARLGGVLVDPADYGRAEVDPVAAESDEFVAHLVDEQPQQVARLCHLLDPALVREARALAPVRVDRHGVTFRIVTGDGAVHARLEFPNTLRHPAQLPEAVHTLESRAA